MNYRIIVPTGDEPLLLPVVPGSSGESSVAAEPTGVAAGQQVLYRQGTQIKMDTVTNSLQTDPTISRIERTAL